MDCKYCGQKIPDSAIICHICRKYKDSWRNWIAVVSGAVALITLVLTGLSYVGKSFSDYYREKNYADRVAVAYFESPGLAGYINAGDKDVFLLMEETICEFRPGDFMGLGREIHMRVSPNDIGMVETDLPARAFGSGQVVDLSTISSRQLQFLQKDSTAFTKITEEFGFPTYPGECTVTYYSFLENMEDNHKFDCECVIFPE